MLFLAYFPYYFLICLVDFRHINGVQIHLRCLYGVMPHALADYWNGYVHISRYACPCMPCGICGEWHFQPCHFTYLLQIIVDVLQHTMILFLFGSVILLNNRKKIGTLFVRIGRLFLAPLLPIPPSDIGWSYAQYPYSTAFSSLLSIVHVDYCPFSALASIVLLSPVLVSGYCCVAQCDVVRNR